MLSLRRFVKFPIRRFSLFLAVLLLSFHQATILTYYDFGREAVAANIDQLPDAYIPNALVLSYIGQLEFSKISAKIAGYAIPLLLVQAIPAVIYEAVSATKGKQKTALAIWLLPALLGSPTLGLTVVYLMSPLFAIFTFPGFMFVLDTTGQTHKEAFAEEVISVGAVIGWFHLFWLAVTIKAWFFSRHRSSHRNI